LCLSDESSAAGGKSSGAALGPDWTNILPIHGSKQARLPAVLFSLYSKQARLPAVLFSL